MKKLLLYLLFLFTIISCANGSVEYTKEEKAWLDKNPLIKLAIMDYWDYDEDGHNIHTQLIYLLNKYGSLNIIPTHYKTWNTGFNDAIKGESIHGIMNLNWSKKREEFFNYSNAYNSKPNLLIVRNKNETIKSLKDLENKTVYVKKNTVCKTILEETSSKINIIELENLKQLLEAFNSKDEADAIFTYKVSSEQLEKYDLKIAKHVYGNHDNQHIGISKKHPELYSIINKAMDAIPMEELSFIQDKSYTKNSKNNHLLKKLFTLEEIKWIKEHPVIKVGGESDWAPFDFVDMNGNYSGLAKEYLDYISELTGLKFEMNIKPWSELLEDLKNKELDLLPAINISNERKKFAHFTVPYLALSSHYITKNDYPSIPSIESLYGKTIVSIKGYDVTSWLKINHPKIKILEVDSILDALRAVEYNQAVAFINDNPSASYNMEKYFITNLKINSLVKNRVPISIYMATNTQMKPLQEILNKVIKSIPEEKKREVRKNWMNKVNTQSKYLNLSQEEIYWLSTSPVLRFAVDPNWLPVEAINPETKEYEGIMADILNKITENSAIKFELVPTQKWRDSVDLMKQNKVDILAAVSITPKRKEFLNFSNKVIELSDGVIMKNNASFITSLESLKGLRVGVPNGTSLHDKLKREYPELILKPINGIEKGLEKLEADEIDAFVGNLEVASHIIFKKSLFNLKVIYKLDTKRDLHIAFNKNVPAEAISLVNKILNIISDKEIQTIRQRWIGLKIDEKMDYTIFYKIALGVLLLIVLFIYWNRKLNQLVEQKTAELNILLDSFDKNVIFSRTDLKGRITHASEAFCKISGYSLDELIGKPHNIVRHPDMPKETFKRLWTSLKKREPIDLEIKNIRKDGTFYWTDGRFEPLYDKEGKHIGYNALRNDITAKKAVEELSENLEYKVIERTKELEIQKKQMESMLSVMLLPLLITSKKTRKIVYANTYAEEQYEGSLEELIGLDIDTFYTCDNQRDAIIDEIIKNGTVKNFEARFKTLKGNEFDAILSLVDIEFGNEECFLGVASDITEQKQREEELRELHQNVRDSIEYASLIQYALIPNKSSFDIYFKEHFAIWNPKDIVGGDIYLFEELRGSHECLLMVIDCTGHGVPGAFVTMLVKAIERQVVSKIVNNPQMEVSPAWILSYFNKSMKRLLKQDSKETMANAGFDGGILYYNKKESLIKYSGAETPLFYFDEDELKMIKGDRQSIGYKKSDLNYEFKEYCIETKEGMQFYISTDGYLDQNGGEKGFPFGKRRFQKVLKELNTSSMQEQEVGLSNFIEEYRAKMEQNDDITVIGLKI